MTLNEVFHSSTHHLWLFYSILFMTCAKVPWGMADVGSTRPPSWPSNGGGCDVRAPAVTLDRGKVHGSTSMGHER